MNLKSIAIRYVIVLIHFQPNKSNLVAIGSHILVFQMLPRNAGQAEVWEPEDLIKFNASFFLQTCIQESISQGTTSSLPSGKTSSWPKQLQNQPKIQNWWPDFNIEQYECLYSILFYSVYLRKQQAPPSCPDERQFVLARASKMLAPWQIYSIANPRESQEIVPWFHRCPRGFIGIRSQCLAIPEQHNRRKASW